MKPQSLFHLTKPTYFSLSGRVFMAQTIYFKIQRIYEKLPPPKGKAIYVMDVSLPEMDR